MADTDTPTLTPAPDAIAAPQGKPVFIWGTGRRKTSVARVRVAPGSGKISINGRELNDYFTSERDRKALFGPFEVTNTGGKMDLHATCPGGGWVGQAGAVILGLARALTMLD